MLRPALFAATLLAAATAHAQIAPLTPSAADPNAPKPKLICKYFEETGSRLNGRKECRTREEWLQVTRDSREALERQSVRGVAGGG